MGADEKGDRQRRSFNLFDVLVIGVLFFGIPLSFWAYSSQLKSIDKGDEAGVIYKIPGQPFAQEAFRVTLVDNNVYKSVFSHMQVGETVFDKGGHSPIGVLREIEQTGRCGIRRKNKVEVCPIKLILDMRCVESDNTVRCNKDSIRINDGFTISGKLYKFDGTIVEIKRLGTDVAVKSPEQNP